MEIEKKILIPIKTENFKNIFKQSSKTQGYKDVLKYFQPKIKSLEEVAFNRYFWFIVDFTNWINCYCGGDFENLTPFKKEEFAGKDQSIIYSVTHPDDLQKVFAFSGAYIDILENFDSDYVRQLRVSLYFRMLNARSEFYWIMVQYPDAILDSNGKIQYGLVFVTDISHIKKDGEATMSLFDNANQKCQQFFCTDKNELEEKVISAPSITIREQEVLMMIARGMGTKEIADKLNIAIKTVDNHRQNMLKKTNSKTSPELISTAMRLGMI